ncbi:MAG: thioredoxin [Cyclobacteriaceae bacterium]
MNTSEFESQVIEASKQTPILVDFWAPWCGPCQHIGPMLEELAGEAKGRWKLVKVNVDESQELSTQYGIRGIPNMKLFVDGEMVAEQTGALPKPEMERWLNEQIPDPRTAALSSILERLKNGDPTALDALKKFVQENPDLDEAKLALSEKLIWDDPELAIETVDKIHHKENYLDRLTGIHDLSELLKTPFKPNGGVSEKLANAQHFLKSGAIDKAIEAIIESVTIDKTTNNELPRRSAIALFNMLGPDHEITKNYRRKFDRSLY